MSDKEKSLDFTARGSTPAADCNRVLLMAPVAIDPQMSGPGIRYWEFARILSQRQSVTLLSPVAPEMRSDCFVVKHCPSLDHLEREILAHDVVVVQGFTLFLQPELVDVFKNRSNYLAVDLYTPLNLEGLELRPTVSREAMDWNLVDVSTLTQQMKLGDFFFCASERQRDYYLGMLSALGRLNPHTYWEDRTARCLIDVVPFGLPSSPPSSGSPVLKGVHPRIAETDTVFLWFGGLWNWLDPLTVIRAFSSVVSERPDARLVFVSRMPEDLDDPASAMVRRAIALSKTLGLYDERVIFHGGIPFNQRDGLLLEVDAGLCYHTEHLEARFSFRTRLLDYIWAGLPIIAGGGDVMADLVLDEGLGYVVPPGDESGMAAAMRSLMDEQDARARRRTVFERVGSQLTWEQALSPLATFCHSPRHAADWGVDAYNLCQSADWERLIFENVDQRYEIENLKRQISERDENLKRQISERDEIIRQLRNGRVMRLMTSVQDLVRDVPWIGRRPENLNHSGHRLVSDEE